MVYIKILITDDATFMREKLKMVIEDYFPAMQRFGDNAMGRYFMPFVISGCIGAIQQWLEDDMKTPSKDMAVFVFEMSMNMMNCNMCNQLKK
jgi:hypothetical protein